MNRWLALTYGGACYLLTGAVAVYTVGFLFDRGVLKSAGRGGEVSLAAILVDLSLIVLFGVQHSVMARAGFKRWWTRIIPQPIERSTYVLVSNMAVVALFAFWQSLPGYVWLVANPFWQAVLWALALCGVALMSAATFAIDHWDLFGLRQVWDFFRRRSSPDAPFKIPLLYRFSRHPMMLGLLIALWATSEMTWGRFVFVAGMSGYVFIGIQFEERDLLSRYGQEYDHYRRRVPMLFGWPRRVVA